MPDPTPENTSEEDDKTPEGKDKAGTQPKPEDALKFTQADLDRVAAKTREEEREKARKAKEKEEAARLEAEAKQQGKFEQLANERQTRLDELEPQLEAATTELNAYKAKVSEMVAEELKALPDKVRDVAPVLYAGEVLTNPLDILAWLPKGKALAEELNGQSAKPGAKSDPKALGAPGNEKADQRARSESRRAYRH